MPSDFEATDERSLVEYMAGLFGFSKLSAALPGRDIYPPYLFVGFFSFLDLAVLQVYVHLTGGTHILIESPNVAAGYAAVLLGLFGIRYISNEYEDALAAIRIQDRIELSDMNQFRRTVSWRTKVAVYVAAVIILYANTLLNVGVPNHGDKPPVHMGIPFSSDHR